MFDLTCGIVATADSQCWPAKLLSFFSRWGQKSVLVCNLHAAVHATLNKTLDLLPLLDGGRNDRHCRALIRKSASVPLGPGDPRVLSLAQDTKRLNYR